MTDLQTIRERIERATAFFETRSGVVLTTFNLSGQFLEDQALPAVLGVEAATVPTRIAGLHGELAKTPCTVFYDPTVAPRVSGKFRYVARPVPLRGRLFHPKLVIIGGLSKDGTTWVYLAVMSANLTLSGWGRNAESFGETWIHTRRQQAWKGLDGLLDWLDGHTPLGEDPDPGDAVAVIRRALEGMPSGYRFRDDDSQPWSGTLYARFYSSVVNKEGLAEFLKGGFSRNPVELWAWSPYWGNVGHLVREFGATRTALVPALRVDRKALGLSKSQLEALNGKNVEVWRNQVERADDRFWHMKAYWIRIGKRRFTAVGSCNFTEAGLSGGNGNVEAMLVFEDIEPDWPEECESGSLEDLSDEPVDEEDVPTPVPVAIVVAYDWQASKWRCFLDADDTQHDFRLSLPGRAAFSIDPGHSERRGTPPQDRGATFTVTYTQGTEPREWRGQVVELHLNHSQRRFGRPLSASDILESWRARVPPPDPGSPRGKGDGEEDVDDLETEVPAAFDAVNLYDLYRAMRGLRTRLVELESQPSEQFALLVRRPDSVMELAKLADCSEEAPVVRYLVLRELWSIMRECEGEQLERDLVRRVKAMKRRARKTTLERLVPQVEGDGEKARKMLNWFEKNLAKMDR